MSDEIEAVIDKDQELVPIIRRFLSKPGTKSYPLLEKALRFLNDDEIKEFILEKIRNQAPKLIKNNQEILQLLNTDAGREYLHKNLDELIEYLTSSRFRGMNPHKCPACKSTFHGKFYTCPKCGAKLQWDTSAKRRR